VRVSPQEPSARHAARAPARLAAAAHEDVRSEGRRSGDGVGFTGFEDPLRRVPFED
jgi:hypothetical protein